MYLVVLRRLLARTVLLDFSTSASGNNKLERTSRVLLSFFFLRLLFLCLSFPSGSTWGAPSPPTVPWDIAATLPAALARAAPTARHGPKLSSSAARHDSPFLFPSGAEGRGVRRRALSNLLLTALPGPLSLSPPPPQPGRGRGQAASRALLPRASPRPAGGPGPGPSPGAGAGGCGGGRRPVRHGAAGGGGGGGGGRETESGASARSPPQRSPPPPGSPPPHQSRPGSPRVRTPRPRRTGPRVTLYGLL